MEASNRLTTDAIEPATVTSTSRQVGGGRSTSRQHHTDRILSVADLSSMPRGRFLVLASGSVPTLGRTQPWYEGKHKDEINESIARVQANRG